MYSVLDKIPLMQLNGCVWQDRSELARDKSSIPHFPGPLRMMELYNAFCACLEIVGLTSMYLYFNMTVSERHIILSPRLIYTQALQISVVLSPGVSLHCRSQ